jgi:hypothetical protein
MRWYVFLSAGWTKDNKTFAFWFGLFLFCILPHPLRTLHTFTDPAHPIAAATRTFARGMRVRHVPSARATWWRTVGFPHTRIYFCTSLPPGALVGFGCLDGTFMAAPARWVMTARAVALYHAHAVPHTRAPSIPSTTTCPLPASISVWRMARR